MALFDRIQAVQQRSPGSFIPFRIENETVGFLPTDLAWRLSTTFDQALAFENDCLVFCSLVSDFEGRSAVLAEISDFFLENKLMPNPRNELYPIKNNWNQTPFALLERNASIPLGLVTYGVNLNAWTIDTKGEKLLWVGKRSLQKQTEPGKLDHIAAGGQPAHISLHANMVKEAEEEASIPQELARLCKPVGAVVGHYHDEYCRRFIHYDFDLELPREFQPKPLDGEVENFQLMSPEQIIHLLRTSDEFDLESTIAIIDWLIRHGFVHAENEPDFDHIYAGLRADLFRL